MHFIERPYSNYDPAHINCAVAILLGEPLDQNQLSKQKNQGSFSAASNSDHLGAWHHRLEAYNMNMIYLIMPFNTHYNTHKNQYFNYIINLKIKFIINIKKHKKVVWSTSLNPNQIHQIHELSKERQFVLDLIYFPGKTFSWFRQYSFLKMRLQLP